MQPRLTKAYPFLFGLSLSYACSDPSQFREIPLGEDPIYVEDPLAKAKSEESPTEQSYAGETENEPQVDSETNEVASQTPAAPDAGPGQGQGQQLFNDCDENPNQPIVADLFTLPVNTKALPDFSQLSALRSVCLSNITIKDRAFTEGFPGVENLIEWFALDMNFRVEAPSSGYYEFRLLSDDGAILWIDDQKIIDNDGLHAVTEKKARVYLSQGSHEFHLSYYQGPRYRIALELFWKVPGSRVSTYIPQNLISRP